METLLLDSNWELKATDRDLARASCSALEDRVIPVQAPFDINQVLFEAGLVDNPYTGGGVCSSRFVSAMPWQASTCFTLTRCKGVRSMLILPSVEGLASVTVNGRMVGRTSNALRRHIIDITDALVDGPNKLSVDFDNLEAALDLGQEANPSAPRWSLIRKSRNHFSIEAVTALGLGGTPYIISDSAFIITSWNCVPLLKDHNWVMRCVIRAKAWSECDVAFTVAVAGRREETLCHVTPGWKDYSFTFTIPEEDVSPWWPAGMGGQHLYPLDICFGAWHDKRMIGFRTIELVNEDDDAGRSFKILVNGSEVFIKGAIWKGLDLLPARVGRGQVIRTLNAASLVGINLLRVDASSAYECEDFYDSCDRLGILVWQDLMFPAGCHPIKDEAWKDEVSHELCYQALRLKSHPSLLLFCAGERPDGIGNDTAAAVAYDRLSHSIIEPLIRKWAPESAFLPHSRAERLDETLSYHDKPSYGLSRFNATSLLKPGEKAAPRFVSSLAFPSLPSFHTLGTFCDDVGTNLSSPMMEGHLGDEDSLPLVMTAVLERYRFPSSLEKLCYLSQLAQAEAIAGAVNRWRRSGCCAGVIVRSLTSDYPGLDESMLEYSGKWKMLMYRLRSLFAPLSVISAYEDGAVKVWAVNDSNDEVEVKISVKFSSFHGDKLKMQVFRRMLPAHSVTHISDTDCSFIKKPSSSFAYVKLSTPDIYREDLVLLDAPRRCQLTDPGIKVELRQSGRNIFCHLSCVQPAFQVYLDAGGLQGTFNENLFSIRPTAEKVVSFNCDEDIKLEDFRKALKVYDLYWAAN